MHFDFTTLKGFKVAPNDKKKNREKGEQEKEDKRVEEKKADMSFNFYIVYA